MCVLKLGGGQISELGDKVPRKYVPPGTYFPGNLARGTYILLYPVICLQWLNGKPVTGKLSVSNSIRKVTRLYKSWDRSLKSISGLDS